MNSDISNLLRSSKNIKFDFFTLRKNQTEELYKLLNIIMEKPEQISYDALHTALNDVQNNYTLALNNFYKEVQNNAIEGIDTTTIINFNRELYSSNKAMVMAVKDLLLNEKEAEVFNDVHACR